MKAVLMLEDGKFFNGESSVAGERVGEAVFNTAVVGYQEMMTDPANAGKILVLTYPLIGNYGCAPKFNESKDVWLAALVIKEKSRITSNWQAKESFDDFIKRNNLVTLTGIDTRSLTVHLRQKGAMQGIVSTKSFDARDLLKKINEFRALPAKSRLAEISVSKPVHCGKKNARARIAVLDLGMPQSQLKQLERLEPSITLLPFDTKAEEILRLKPKGLIVSGGPEADPGLKEVTENLKPLIGKIPLLGLGAGHQAIARALGAKVIRMKSGHHGSNYPVQNPSSYKGEITVQNHDFAVDIDSLAKIKEVKVTGFNLNDRTVEEMESKKLKLLGVQYVPACPGFSEISPVFVRFLKSVK